MWVSRGWVPFSVVNTVGLGFGDRTLFRWGPNVITCERCLPVICYKIDREILLPPVMALVTNLLLDDTFLLRVDGFVNKVLVPTPVCFCVSLWVPIILRTSPTGVYYLLLVYSKYNEEWIKDVEYTTTPLIKFQFFYISCHLRNANFFTDFSSTPVRFVFRKESSESEKKPSHKWQSHPRTRAAGLCHLCM